MNDCRMIKKVIVGIRNLSRRGLEVDIAVSKGGDKDYEKAKTLARQRGRKASRSRRRRRSAYNSSAGDQEESVPDHRTLKLVIRSKEHARDELNTQAVGQNT